MRDTEEITAALTRLGYEPEDYDGYCWLFEAALAVELAKEMHSVAWDLHEMEVGHLIYPLMSMGIDGKRKPAPEEQARLDAIRAAEVYVPEFELGVVPDGSGASLVMLVEADKHAALLRLVQMMELSRE